MADTPDQLATVADLATWLGTELDSDDEARAAFILSVASSWARDISGRAWPDRSAADFPRTVWGIVLAGARREFENPRHVVYEVKGPETGSYNAQAYPPGFFTDPELKHLRRYRPGGGLFTIGTYRDDPCESLGYLNITDMSKPLPMYNPWEPGWEDSIHS